MLLAGLAFCLAPGSVGLREAFHDALQRTWPRERISAPATIVAIDDRSLRAQGQWPWPRTRIATLVERIGAAGPAAVGLDLLFPEADRFSPAALTEAISAPRELAAALHALPDPDRVLGDTLGRYPVVLGIAGLNVPDPRFTTPPKAAPLLAAPGALDRVLRFPGLLRSRDEIDRGALGRGLISAESRDGIVREVPVIARIGAVPVAALSLEMWRVATGTPALRLDHGAQGLLRVRFGDVSVPLQANGSMYLRYSPHDPARFVSAQDVLEGTVDPDLLRGRLVLVGVTELGLVDQVATPLGERVPGVELHAQLIEQVFDGRFLVRPAWAIAAEGLAVLALGLLLIAAVPALSARNAALLGVVTVVAPLGVSAAAFVGAGLWFDGAAPALCAAIVFGVMLAGALSEADRQRRTLREATARTEGELEAARRIQLGLLPDPGAAIPAGTGVEVQAYLEPARSVGGDFYDCFMLDRHRVFFAVADVSGKGMPAALFMALSKAILKSTVQRGQTGLASAMTQVCSELSRENPEALFVTAFAGILDVRSGALEYCNAGHEPPYARLPGGSVERYPVAEGPPLCVIDDFEYGAYYRSLAPGESLCVVTDGITEAMDRAQSFFSGERIVDALGKAPPDAHARDLLARLRDAVAGFVGEAPAADDMTLLVLRWNGAVAPHDDAEPESL